MARKTQQLTDTQIKKAKAGEKVISLSDGGGLYLQIELSGTKTWLFKYAKPYTKKRTNKTIGNYPTITLAQARTNHSLITQIKVQLERA